MRATLTILAILTAALLGAVGTGLVLTFPNQPVEYTVTSKTRCLTAEGLSFKMKYNGVGIASFKVLPPSPGDKPEKEKQ